jgi:hypothetical protein
MAEKRLLAVFAHPDDETFRCGVRRIGNPPHICRLATAIPSEL